MPNPRKWTICRRIAALVSIVFLMTCCPDAAFTQGSSDDYDRWASLDRRTANRVFRDRIDPNWFGADKDRFWYRIKTGTRTHEFLLVDAATGQRQPAFDHPSLADALGEQSGRDVSPGRINIQSLSFNDGLDQCRFRFANENWSFDLPTGPLARPDEASDVSKAVEGLVALDEVARSIPSSEVAPIRFDNRSDQVLEIFWVDPQGKRKSYGDVRPGTTHTISSFTGHAWVLVGDQHSDVAAFVVDAWSVVAVIDADAPRPMPPKTRRAREDRARAASRSPDANWMVAFDDHNVVLKHIADETEDVLTVDGSRQHGYGGRVWWSPDSTAFVVLRTRRVEERKISMIDSAPDDSIHSRVKTITYVKPGDELEQSQPVLFRIDDPTPMVIDNQLFRNPFAINDLAWHADSQSFSFVYNQRGHQVLRVVTVDAKSGIARVMIDETSETFVCYSQKKFLMRLDESNEAIWMSERSGWNHLYLIDQTSGKVKNSITSGQWVVREVERVDQEKRQLWLKVSGIDPGQDPYHLHLVRVDFDGKNLTRLTEGDGNHQWRFSPDERFLIDTYSRVDMPPVIELRSAESGRLICELERADVTELLATGWQMPERFVATGRDGQSKIYGIIIRPTKFDTAKRYPVLEDIYAGPHSAFVPKSFGRHVGMTEMAELGFIVVKIDAMGTNHRSKAFHDVCWKNLADSGFPDRIAWIQSAAKDRPEMDLRRVGIWGGSAGGQSAMRALIDHGDFYHAAVADCGCHDNRVDKIWWNEQWMGWPIGDHYQQQSNVTGAARLQGELMLIWGELDTNVDPASTTQVIDALVKADKDFEQLVMPGVGHGAAGHPYAKRRQADFFVRKLWHREPRHKKQSGTTDLIVARTPTRDLLLDLYQPTDGGRAPLVVFVHGGGWQNGSHKRCSVKWLTQHGFAVASISYRLTDEATFPAQIHDCKAAVRWLRAHEDDYGYDATRIGAIGTSAGGHLVALMGTTGDVAELEGDLGYHTDQDSRVQCVVDFYGPTDFILRGKTQPHKVVPPDSSVHKLLGGNALQMVERAQQASAAFHVSEDDPPILIFHGAKDKKVLLVQSERIAQAYRDQRLDMTMRILPNAGHGGAEFMNDQNRDAIVRFLNRHLKP
ncbi:MAG: prolyl oligopeptidase family serine peptidase [Pirellulaceae bacterium]|nr:prolyl oligopeptidase family serine peptidase [Pirellulaceae bacterium]